MVAIPIRAVGGVIEGDRRFPVRFGRGLRRGAGCAGRAVVASKKLASSARWSPQVWAQRWPRAWADGSAPSVVGSAVARSEDGPSVGSSEPPQATSSTSRISAKAKTPRPGKGEAFSSCFTPCVCWAAVGRRVAEFYHPAGHCQHRLGNGPSGRGRNKRSPSGWFGPY